MTVRELIAFLEKQPQDLPVVYRRFSEQCLLRETDIDIENFAEARPDGWVANMRGNVPTRPYLVLPGN